VVQSVRTLAVFVALACLTAAVGTGTAQGAVTREEVWFRSGPDTLSGFLLLPEGAGPFPAFVLIQGSGPASIRLSWEPGHWPFWSDIAAELVRRGFAVLAFDKPGVGLSTGDWQTQSFHDRAKNVRDAIAHLKSHPAIQPNAIGVIGRSQGGWIAQLVAAEAPDDVALVISLAGPAISVKEQVVDDVIGQWQCQGRPSLLQSLGRAGLHLGLSVYELASLIRPIGYLGRLLAYEPREALEVIRQPLLMLFAENDRLVYADKNAALAREYLTRAGHRRFAIETVPGANHFFQQSDFCERTAEARWAEGFWEAFDHEAFWTWVREEVGRGAQSQGAAIPSRNAWPSP